MSKVSTFPRFVAGHRSTVLSIARPIADWNYQDELERYSDTCSPDFIVNVAGEAARGVRRVLIETEGFADEAYRVRTSEVHGLMAKVTGAPVVLHDLQFPIDRVHSAGDRPVGLDFQWTVTGSTDPARSQR